jgi:hypothetical protein
LSSRRRKPRTAAPAPHAASADLKAIRADLRSVIERLKALDCTDSMILVEFWHALDSVNGDQGLTTGEGS